MRVAIAGAGNVGRSIAQELIENGHQVLLIERQPSALRPERVPTAEWILADCCELASLQEADLASCDVVVAATGDDKVNLVLSLLAKTEFAVPRVVARVNRAENEWLFTEQWGVDVSVSKPRLMAALVEEAVTVGDLVRLMTFRQVEANLVEITLPRGRARTSGSRSATCRCPATPRWSRSCAASGCSRRRPDDPLEAGDELVFVCTAEVEDDVRSVILGASARAGDREPHALDGPVRPASGSVGLPLVRGGPPRRSGRAAARTAGSPARSA